MFSSEVFEEASLAREGNIFHFEYIKSDCFEATVHWIVHSNSQNVPVLPSTLINPMMIQLGKIDIPRMEKPEMQYRQSCFEGPEVFKEL